MITPLSESLCVLKGERSSLEFHQFTLHGLIVLIDGEALHFDPISFGTCDLARTSHVSLVSQVSRHVRRSDCRPARLVEFRLTPRWGHRHFRWRLGGVRL